MLFASQIAASVRYPNREKVQKKCSERELNQFTSREALRMRLNNLITVGESTVIAIRAIVMSFIQCAKGSELWFCRFRGSMSTCAGAVTSAANVNNEGGAQFTKYDARKKAVTANY